MNLPRGFGVHAAAVLMTGLLISLTGCHSRAQSASTKLGRPYPPVKGIDEIRREDAIAKRSRELINEGKYTTTSDARRAAVDEIPYVSNNDNYQSDRSARLQKAG